MSPRLLILSLAVALLAIFFFMRRSGVLTEPDPTSQSQSDSRHRPGRSSSDDQSSDRPSSKSADRGARKSGRAPLLSTASGLQYRVLREGDGPRPGPKDRVRVLYEGTTEDGTVFDSTAERGASTFPLGGVIKGWQEGLQLMPPGSKYLFIIPPELAYGRRGAPPLIPSNATLTFEVELLEVISPEARPPTRTRIEGR